MPRGDRRGPEGMGPMTGRGMGYCNNYPNPGFTKGVPRGGAGFNQGYRRGMGGGRGYRNFGYQNYAYPQTNVDESKLIENEMEILKNQMSILEKRLSEIKKDQD